MEVLSLLTTGSLNNIDERIVFKMLNNFKKGLLTITNQNGQTTLIGDREGLHVDLKIKNKNFYQRVILGGDIGFAESYMYDEWESSDLTKLIQWTIQNIEHNSLLSGSSSKSSLMNIMSFFNRLIHLKNKNTKTGSSKNIEYHYDLSNDLYKLFLDQTMTYSCAVFGNEELSLERAQINKYKTICEKLDIKENDHILEIGCGWGGFIHYATTYYNCHITAVTLSQEQFDYTKKLIEKNNLENKVDLRLMDYRDLEGEFDKIVSIEMIEAVGHEFLPEYFKKIDSLLKPRGVAVIQAITALDSRYEDYRKSVDFIQKYIFPGGHLPSLRAITKACDGTELNLYNVNDIGLDYAKTLRAWYDSFSKRLEEVKNLGFDDRFIKMWSYYLNYCEAAFLERNISTAHITLVKPNSVNYNPIRKG